MTTLDTTELTPLRQSLTGAVLAPSDEGYEAARKIWNGQIDRRPAVIAQVAGPADVAAALAFAREHALPVSVRGGGHSFGGFSVCENGLLIDLSGLRAVVVDPQARTLRCGGGTTWAELDAAGQQEGLAVPGGTISDTGVGGLTLGGGVGWLTSRHGLSIDNLLSVEVVTADGVTRRASEEENADLFWALRGGGGNFGVVTEFEFRGHPVGPMIEFGLFFWPLAQGPEALRFIRDTLATLPPTMGAMLVGLNAPPAEFVPPEAHFAPGYALVIAGFEGPEEHAAVVAQVRRGLPTAFELVTPIPYVALQQMLDEAAPRGTLSYEKALYVDELSDEVLDVIAEYLPRKASPMSIMPMFVMREAFTRVPEDATAFGGTRSPKLAVNIAAMAPEQPLFETDRAWVREFWAALTPFASGAGGYVNFMTEYDENRVRAAYGADKYERLALLKAEYDPGNVFHLGANIRPAVTV
ncbi:FAD-binding oxidoreductase [Amycolatopsis rhabdoformis]|uniref:FAD-binding oxidoreductase n=1 Tax=Amycolatopsis rhabdoformis TaxID=1448059 RepID=A0ABZ1I8M4_9PSEU|nr:FAD-binding oxidoreductase [Amycolatopsis rhabdoformis]WSE30041.1 FAD-binding oxidoreductase [Amycolatopsis rhabdoformis]